MKRLAFLLLLLLPALTTQAEKVATLPAPTSYVDDFASVLSSSTRTKLEALCNEVHNKTKAQIFFVTIKTTEGEEAKTFANQLFAKWKIGEKKTDRGVLLLLSINDHKRWIEVGYGLEGILNDAKVGDIGRAMVPGLRAADYNAAAQIGISQLAQIIALDSGVTLETSTTEAIAASESEAQPQPERPLIHNGSPWILAILIPLFLGPFIGIVLLARHNRRRYATFGSSSSSSDSFRSSSSSSSDSSSSDFGGGDGGSSGGGGAGGDW